MAFIPYYSNRQEDLFALFAQLLRQPHHAPTLTPERVVIPNLGTAKWLTMRLAEQMGIAANLSFELPVVFVGSLVKAILPDLAEPSLFRPDVLSWRIYCLLKQNKLTATAVQHYLRHADSLQTYQLAQTLAELFDQYMVYRSDWLLHWEDGQQLGLGDDEAWQAVLWRLLTQQEKTHQANILHRLFAALAARPTQLPTRILCFGVNHVPPVYITLLQALGEVTDVHYFVLNPCKENWLDDRDYQEQLRLAGREDPELLYLELGHPLLSSWAKQGRDFFARLAEVPSVAVFADDDEIAKAHLLQRIQADIVGRTVPQNPTPSPLDDSLSIQSCHSPMREIEVLHDHLLHWLQADLNLNPADILVLAPDIDVYTPYIDAVFTAPDAPVDLPFSVADKNPLQHSALFASVLALLALPSQRFDVEEVFAAISHPAVLRRFGLQMHHLPLLRTWIEQVHIHWGRDAEHKSAYGLPPDGVHTWRDGLERLLLACALPQEMADGVLPVFAGRCPGPTIDITQRAILAGFVSLLDQLMQYAERFCLDRPVPAWITDIFQLLDDCVQADEEETQELAILQSQLAQIAQEVEYIDTASCAVDVIVWRLQQRLQDTDSRRGFLGQGITFCNMVPLRAIPAKVICVLGLNHDTFPRQMRQHDMDLMRDYPRAGDRSRQHDDRYLFLETVLSARDRLYLSYVGQDIRTNQPLPSSVLVDELLEVVDTFYPVVGGTRAQLVIQHALQPFNRCYFKVNSVLQSFQTTWLQVAQTNQLKKQTRGSLFPSPLPAPPDLTALTLETLLRFYRHPTRFLLRSRLDVVLPWQQQVADSHDVVLNKRERLHVRARIMQYTTHAQQVLRLEGALPAGVFGEYCYQEEQQSIEAWLAHAQGPWPTQPLRLPPIELDNWQIAAVLPAVNQQHGVILRSLHDIPSAHERIAGWLQHLLLCIAAPAGVRLATWVSGIRQQYHYTHCSCSEAAVRLLPWLTYLRTGMERPLPFFARTSLCFAEQLHKGKSTEEAKKAAQQIFCSVRDYRGERDDPYIAAVAQVELGERFADIAQTLLLPMLIHQQGHYVSL